MKTKKSVIGPIISVFVMVLIVSILAGLTFLFVSQLKTQSLSSATGISFTIVNESGTAGAEIGPTGYTLLKYGVGWRGATINVITNGTSATLVSSGNYTLSDTGVLTNASAVVWTPVNISYTYTRAELGAYNSINKTESAGATLVDYLPLIFLAIIFGAILTLVLKIILPYLNLGKSMSQF